MSLNPLNPGGGGSGGDSGETGGLGVTGFGETSTISNFPFIQADPLYNLVPSNFRTFTSGSGTSGVSDKKFTCTTGTSVGGYGAVQSFRSLNHKSGQSAICRFSGYFESSAANSWQGIGLLNLGDELSFGYNGTSFGIWHRRNGIAEVRTITVTTPASGSENLTLTLNSVAYTIPLTSGTAAHNAYEIQDWLRDNQSVWGADQIDGTVVISALSDGAKSGTYTFSSGTAAGTIAQNTAGVTKTSDFVNQADWNQSTASFLDPTKGNIYQIIYKNTGFGGVFFYVDNPTNGTPLLVHFIQYQNTSTDLSLGNPSLRTGLYCVSLGSTTNLTVRVASISAYLQGLTEKTRNPRAYFNTQSVSTTFTNILTLRNRRTYNNIINQVEVQPISLTISSESPKNVSIEIRSTVNPGVEQNFTAVGTNLITDVDTTSTTITGGRLLAAYTVAPAGNIEVNLNDKQIRIPPTLNLVIQAKVTGGADSPVSASLIWYEDL